jgi:23S rRNA (uracil1939-C5)-methyltransferase
MDYQEQLALKQKILSEALIKSGIKGFKTEPFHGMETPYGCRNKMSMLNHKGKLVFTLENSRSGLEIGDCPMETAANREAYKIIKKKSFPPEILQFHLRSSDDGKTGICLFVKRMTGHVRRTALDIAREVRSVEGIGARSYRFYNNVSGKDYLAVKTGGITYRIPHGGFFQTNLIQAEYLQRLVTGLLDCDPGSNILDLYCGSAFFSIPAARKAGNVLGIESDPEAARCAALNASINAVENALFIHEDVEKALKDVRKGKFRTAIIDPPREGCGRRVMQEILRIRPACIIYISCSPVSLAGDLTEIGGSYRAVYCQGIDMFPQTLHFETVLVLTPAL